MSSIMSRKVLTENDLRERFVVPMPWFDEIWPDQNWRNDNLEVPLTVVHQVTLDEAIWYDFVLSTRGQDKKNPVFNLRGWGPFVRDNNLRIGDVVYFGKKGGENHYTIMVERKYV